MPLLQSVKMEIESQVWGRLKEMESFGDQQSVCAQIDKSAQVDYFGYYVLDVWVE
jgi:hypothetical protein